ncbi:HalOD1 output domain-containing protein [Halogeometricum limi]|uniref:Halobacterial output domain-containing protein n=1 Tax=Halogeometricum limi TaxID=555875 RepID=A0A1I6IJ51_9EURY|nr:HalOD1 output domain-containing protein [Halogeometricum limi]SFR66689.1 hypothetical protein SAMN04488124_3273 [Halogeometricum limi]
MTQKHGGKTVDEDLDWQIVTAVADAKGVEPLELGERLHDVVDLDAVKQLFVGMPSSESMVEGHVSFTLDGCEVVVDQSWDVDVIPQTEIAAD